MAHIQSPGQVSTDGRSLLERLRRVQLQQVAEKAGIQYPNGAKHHVLVSLLEAHNVDPREYMKFGVVYGRDESGMPTQEEYPIVDEPASVRNGVDANNALQQKLDELTPEQQEESDRKDSRLEKLEKENADLQDKLGRVLALLEAKEKNKEKVSKLRTLAEKKAHLRAKGIDTRGMSREDVETALEE